MEYKFFLNAYLSYLEASAKNLSANSMILAYSTSGSVADFCMSQSLYF